MHIPGFIKREKSVVGTHHTYGLTALGKTKAEEFAMAGPRWQVLACLDENGPSSVTEISEEVKTNPEKVKALLRALMKSGYVRRVSQED